MQYVYCDVLAFMAQERIALVRVSAEERRLIFAGYYSHVNNWSLVVCYVLQHTNVNNPLYIYINSTLQEMLCYVATTASKRRHYKRHCEVHFKQFTVALNVIYGQ